MYLFYSYEQLIHILVKKKDVFLFYILYFRKNFLKTIKIKHNYGIN